MGRNRTVCRIDNGSIWKHQIIHSIHSLEDKSKQYERKEESSTSPIDGYKSS